MTPEQEQIAKISRLNAELEREKRAAGHGFMAIVQCNPDSDMVEEKQKQLCLAVRAAVKAQGPQAVKDHFCHEEHIAKMADEISVALLEQGWTPPEKPAPKPSKRRWRNRSETTTHHQR